MRNHMDQTADLVHEMSIFPLASRYRENPFLHCLGPGESTAVQHLYICCTAVHGTGYFTTDHPYEKYRASGTVSQGGAVPYGQATRVHSTVYSTVQYSIQYSTVQYSKAVQYSTVQYSTVQYSTVVVNCQLL